MKSSIDFTTGFHRTDEWQSLRGTFVEVCIRGKLYRSGYVDEAMPDATGVWIAAHGAFGREFIQKADDYEIWTYLYPRPPRRTP
jgi:hypothetical protein